MTLGLGVALILGLLCVGYALRFVWLITPVYQCPECYSYRIDASNEGEPFNQCRECGKQWREE